MECDGVSVEGSLREEARVDYFYPACTGEKGKGVNLHWCMRGEGDSIDEYERIKGSDETKMLSEGG